jgi:hypothetical protein
VASVRAGGTGTNGARVCPCPSLCAQRGLPACRTPPRSAAFRVWRSAISLRWQVHAPPQRVGARSQHRTVASRVPPVPRSGRQRVRHRSVPCLAGTGGSTPGLSLILALLDRPGLAFSRPVGQHAIPNITWRTNRLACGSCASTATDLAFFSNTVPSISNNPPRRPGLGSVTLAFFR